MVREVEFGALPLPEHNLSSCRAVVRKIDRVSYFRRLQKRKKKRRGMLLWGMIDGIVQVDEVDLIHGISRC